VSASEKSSVPQQRRKLGEHLVDDIERAMCDVLRVSRPVHSKRCGETYFKRVPLRLAGHRTDQRKSGFLAVKLRTQHQCRTAAGLLASGLRVEREPDQIPGVGDVPGRHHDSLPAGGPQFVSWWRFRFVIPETSWRKPYRRRADRMTMLPSLARSSDKRSPSASFASWAIAFGILTARLLPHFES
jgi:hypothetical protein